jgi:hypothetical protein
MDELSFFAPPGATPATAQSSVASDSPAVSLASSDVREFDAALKSVAAEENDDVVDAPRDWTCRRLD